MKNWKTTMAGIGAILIAVGAAVKAFATVGIGAVDLATTLTAITAGIGLIAAKDASNPTSTP